MQYKTDQSMYVSNGLQPNSNGLEPNSDLFFLCFVDSWRTIAERAAVRTVPPGGPCHTLLGLRRLDVLDTRHRGLGVERRLCQDEFQPAKYGQLLFSVPVADPILC